MERKPLFVVLIVGICASGVLAKTSPLAATSNEVNIGDDEITSCGISASLDRLTRAISHEGSLRVGRHAVNVEERLDALQHRVGDLQAEVAALKAVGMGKSVGPKVFFNVLRQRKLACYGCVVTFDQSSADTHEAFDLSAGTFAAPVAGHYFFQFHALVEAGFEAQVEILVNDVDAVHLFDRDVDGENRRFAMLGQSFIRRLETGDVVKVRLHKGALKGGDTTTYTSFVGVLLDSADHHAAVGHNII